MEQEAMNILEDQSSHNELSMLLSMLVNMRKQKENIEESLKEKKADIANTEQILLHNLVTAGMKNFTNDDGIQVVRRKNIFVNCNKADEPKLFDWLKERGDDGLIKPSVHHSTLKSYIKELKEEGGEIPEFIKIHEEEGIQIRNS